MAKVRTLSRTFMKGHPKEGQPTYFVEKFYNQQGIKYKSESFLKRLMYFNIVNIESGKLTREDIIEFWKSLKPTEEDKHHTIRNGEHFKAGDKISLRTWFGKPYATPQIILAPDIPLKKVYKFQIMKKEMFIHDRQMGSIETVDMAIADGLRTRDFLDWFKFPKEFSGQVLIWSDKIKY